MQLLHVINSSGEEDVNNLNILVQSSIWKNSMWAIALLKPVDSGLTDMLAHYGQGVSVSTKFLFFVVVIVLLLF